MSWHRSLFIVVLLLLGNAFFVAAEFALISSRRTVLEPQAADVRAARIALKAMSQIPLMIAGSQLGVTICSLGLGAIAEPALAHLLARPVPRDRAADQRGRTRSRSSSALGFVVFVHTVIGEMVPKNLTLAGPEKAVLWLGPPMLGFCIATKPLLVAMKWLSRTGAADLAGRGDRLGQDRLHDRGTGQPRRRVADRGPARPGGARADHRRAGAARPYGRATRCCRGRSVTTVSDDVSPAALEVLASRTGRSRFPVVERESRRVLGFVHVKDVLGVVGPARRQPIAASLIRELPVLLPGSFARRGAARDAAGTAAHRAGQRRTYGARGADARRCADGGRGWQRLGRTRRVNLICPLNLLRWYL